MSTTLPSQQCHVPKTNNQDKEREGEEDYEKTYQKYNELIQTLPKEKGWLTDQHVFQYQGYWLSPAALKAAMLLQNHFKARPTDIFLTAFMKCGTTWLRSLMFATMNRQLYNFSNHPLLKIGPHDCFPFLDAYIHHKYPIADFEVLPSPRLFGTHLPFTFFPKSVKSTGSKFIYIWRDPKDVLISLLHFTNRIKSKELPTTSLEEGFEMFCGGISHYGPFWDHVLGYWKASLESPDKILFLRYEKMKKDTSICVKKLAEFMGCPFSPEELKNGVVQDIIKLCGFENLRNLEVNKTGVQKFSAQIVIENREFFRKGEVGDGKNHLSDEMIERIDRITEQKFKGSGLIL